MAKSKPPIEDQDRELFRQTLKGIAPIKAKPRQPKPEPPGKKFIIHPRRHTTQPNIDIELMRPEEWISGLESMQFSRGGLQHRLLQRLQRGQIPVEAQLDLHRFNVNEALLKTEQFIAACSAKQIRFICIVHGKGNYSPTGKPLIKNALNRWLREQPSVLAFHSAQPRHGGTGAVYVLLKIKPPGNPTHEK